MEAKTVARGLAEYKENKRANSFVLFEILILTGLLTWFAVSKINPQIGISVFILSFIAIILLSKTALYKYIGMLLSVMWGLIGFGLLFSLGGFIHAFFSFVTGGIGFFLGWKISYNTRNRGINN